jgi:hypothetical protein
LSPVREVKESRGRNNLNMKSSNLQLAKTTTMKNAEPSPRTMASQLSKMEFELQRKMALSVMKKEIEY